MNVLFISIKTEFLINKNMDHVFVIVEGLYKVELGIIRFRWNRFSFLRFGFIDGRPPFEQTPRRIPYSHANSCIPRYFSKTRSPRIWYPEFRIFVRDEIYRENSKSIIFALGCYLWILENRELGKRNFWEQKSQKRFGTDAHDF